MGLGMEIWFPGFGYYKATSKSPLAKEGFLLSWGLSWELNFKRSRISISTSWNGLGGNFSFSDPFRVGYRYYTGTINNFMPSFYAAAKLSKIKLKVDDTEFRRIGWGGELGIAFEGPFERVGYFYTTAAGGYHSIELYFASGSIINGKAGTRYLFQKSDDAWMIKASIYIQGWNSLARGSGFRKENNRPFIHKALSYVGFAPALVWAIPIYFISITGTR